MCFFLHEMCFFKCNYNCVSCENLFITVCKYSMNEEQILGQQTAIVSSATVLSSEVLVLSICNANLNGHCYH